MKNNSLFDYRTIAVLAVLLITWVMFGGTSMAQQNNEVTLNREPKIVVTVDVFSGRPNPSFDITEPTEIARLQDNLTKLPAVMKTAGDIPDFGRLGYRGILIANPSRIKGVPAYVQVLEGKVKVWSTNTGGDARFFTDAAGMEKYYLGLAKDRGLILDLVNNNIVPDPDAM
jgi:hypothetical protein